MAFVWVKRFITLAIDIGRLPFPTADRTHLHDRSAGGVDRGAIGVERPQGLTVGERRWLWITDLPFLVFALAALAWIPPQRDLDVLVCALLVVGYALASHVRIPLHGVGSAPAVQLMFVPMLFLAPLNLVPLLVLAGELGYEAVAAAMGQGRPRRAVLSIGNSWYALGPVAILVAAGHNTFDWSHWPLYMAAVAAQIAINAAAGYARTRLAEGAPPPLADVLGVPALIDVTLAVPALTAVAVASDAPVAAALTLLALLAVARGVSSEHSGRLAARHHATHDPLTGLPNRLLFNELAASMHQRARRDGLPGAVMIIDVNDFKHINDELGHMTGDLLLAQIAARLRASVRGADTVARIGGDEFAVLLAGQQSSSSCDEVARKLRSAFDAPFDLRIGPRRVGVAVGSALIIGHRPLEDALIEADVAMYAGKPGQSGQQPRDTPPDA